MDTEPLSIEELQNARRARAIAADPKGWKMLSIREKVQTYNDGKFLPCSAEWVDRLFSPDADAAYVEDFKSRWPFEYRMCRALWLETR
jgi:hypothetical protein